MLKTFSLVEINVTKNALFFLRKLHVTHHRFPFNLLCAVKYKVFSLKPCAGFSIFDSVSFLLKFIFFV